MRLVKIISAVVIAGSLTACASNETKPSGPAGYIPNHSSSENFNYNLDTVSAHCGEYGVKSFYVNGSYFNVTCNKPPVKLMAPQFYGR